MKVGITGAGGYVGSHLARYLEERGHAVVRLSRSRGFRLGEPVRPEIVTGLDALIHAAYDFAARGAADIERVNVKGSIALFEAAAAAGVGRLIFISSMAAFPTCRSLYGRGKLAVETHVLRLGGDAVRPGTIYGGEAGGIFRSVSALAEKLPVIPLPGGGQQVFYLIHIDDLSALIERLLGTDLPDGRRLLRVACPEPLTLREVITRIARGLGQRRVFLPVPAALVMTGLRVAETVLGRQCPVRSDSLLSLLNPDPAPDFSLPAALAGARFRGFETAHRQ
ncbi:MAG: NAD-dependent epimerase/dehydratase family protein [Verrucomicrobiia bacterium]|jgi:nucleoside-diphosphate-sugar epimerase